MVGSRSNTARQRGMNKVRKARGVVMLLLLLVAGAIVFIDKKEEAKPIELSQEQVNSATESNGTTTTSENFYEMAVFPSNNESGNQSAQNNSPGLQEQGNSQIVNTVDNPTLVKNRSQREFGNNYFVKPNSSRSLAAKNHFNRSRSKNILEKIRPGFHRVARGETLSHISVKYYGKEKYWRAIYHANRGIMRSPKSLRVGQQLRIPENIPSMSSSKRRRSSIAAKRNRSRQQFRAVAVKNGTSVHVVARGENLHDIAKREGLAFLSLLDHNPRLKKNPNYIREGMRIVIPVH